MNGPKDIYSTIIDVSTYLFMSHESLFFARNLSCQKKLKYASHFQFVHWDICILIIIDINASILHTAYKIGILILPYE